MELHSTRTLVLKHREDGCRLAKKFLRAWGKSPDEEDVRSAVDIALCEAAQSFDPSYGTQFMTHAHLFIKNKVLRLANWYLKSYPIAFRKSPGESGLEQQDLDCAAENASGGNDLSLGSNWGRPDQLVLLKQLLCASESALKKLPAEEAELIRRTFLFGETLQDLTDEYGCSRPQLSRIRLRALRNLRQILEA